MKILRKVIDDMLAHAREEAPNECCGLLVGDRGAVERNIRTRNGESSPTRYLIDPGDHFAAIHAARLEGKRIVGAYHSHPVSAPAPSESDLAEATSSPEFLYVIVSVMKPEGEVFAYRLKHGSVSAVRLEED